MANQPISVLSGRETEGRYATVFFDVVVVLFRLDLCGGGRVEVRLRQIDICVWGSVLGPAEGSSTSVILQAFSTPHHEVDKLCRAARLQNMRREWGTSRMSLSRRVCARFPRRTKTMGRQLPEGSRKQLCRKLKFFESQVSTQGRKLEMGGVTAKAKQLRLATHTPACSYPGKEATMKGVLTGGGKERE